MEFSLQPQIRKILQKRLSLLVVLFVFLYCFALTLAPYTRLNSWNFIPAWQPWLGFITWLICAFLTERNAERSLPKRDLFLLPITFLLVGWGLMTIYRLSSGLGLRQTIWLVAGAIVLNLIIRFPRIYELIRRYRIVWLVAVLVLIVLTLLPGLLFKNGQPILWLSIGNLNLQPSEPLKFALLIYLAGYFSSQPILNFRSWQTIVPTFFIFLVCGALLILQRDLGTATLIFAVFTFFIYTINPRKRILIISSIGLIVTALAGSLLFEVIRWRAEAWLNPWLDPTDRSYQIVQSLMAAASGGLFGTGPGMGAPNLIPVAVSDFIFVAIFEETGLLGVSALLLLIILFFTRTIYAARNADNLFSALLAGGIGLLFSIQSILIVGGNIRLFPLTGVTLPLVSYGGSSLVMSMAAVGLLVKISTPGVLDVHAERIHFNLKKFVFPVITAGFILILVLCGYWAVIRKDGLLARGDNLRKLRANQYVARGKILDSNGLVITGNSGDVGSFSRVYLETSLGSTVGYESTTYGVSGLESALDPYLRGYIGHSDSTIWWQNLLTSLPPQGLDLRLTVDNRQQSRLNDLVGNQAGAGVVINAKTGEILALVSSPNFDANNLESEWDSLIKNPQKPLFNRALDGRYSAGTAIGVFMLAEEYEQNKTVLDLNIESLSYQGQKIECSWQDPSYSPITLKGIIQASCPQTNLSIAKILTPTLVYNLFDKLGFYKSIDLGLVTPEIKNPGSVKNIKTASIGQENLSISPLHMALAAASISSGGDVPNPKITLAYQNPDGKWKLFPADSNVNHIFSGKTTESIWKLTSIDNLPAWGVVGNALNGKNQKATWFVGGTTGEWQGSPISVAILFEESNPAKAMQIGTQMLQSLTTQLP